MDIRNSFRWWYGVVEDRNDPLLLGRVRVRIFYYHTDDKTKMPTEHLPWATIMQPVTSAAISGKGDSPTGLLEGTTVVGFFQDGETAQYPIVMGTIAGIPTDLPDINKGFNDPNGIYPTYSKKPDTNSRARNDSVDMRTPESFNGALGTSFIEPEDFYTASYPKNHIHESESGHYREFDDTPSHERIKEFHKSGSFYEVGPDGTRVTRIVGDDFEVVVRDKNVAIKGNCNVVVDGNANIRASAVNLETDTLNAKVQEYNLTIAGESHIRYEGSNYVYYGGDTHTTKESGFTDFVKPSVRTSSQNAVEPNEV